MTWLRRTRSSCVVQKSIPYAVRSPIRRRSSPSPSPLILVPVRFAGRHDVRRFSGRPEAHEQTPSEKFDSVCWPVRCRKSERFRRHRPSDRCDVIFLLSISVPLPGVELRHDRFVRADDLERSDGVHRQRESDRRCPEVNAFSRTAGHRRL